MSFKTKGLLAAGWLFFLTLAGAAWAAGPDKETLVKDIKRFQALGGQYRAEGFPAFPTEATTARKSLPIPLKRQTGRAVYVNSDGIRIWKKMVCGYFDNIYLELSVRTKDGRHIPFAWQDCFVPCERGGYCRSDQALYLDLTGDGRPEVSFERLSAVSETTNPVPNPTRLTFRQDILPSWVRTALGPSLENLSPVDPDTPVGNWEDSPLGVEDISETIGGQRSH